MTAEWVDREMVDPSVRSAYISRNLLPAHLPAAIDDFPAFYEARQALLRDRLIEILGAQRGEESREAEVQWDGKSDRDPRASWRLL